VSPSTPPSTPGTSSDRAVAVGLFERDSQARQAVEALRGLGLTERQVGVLVPDAAGSAPTSPEADVSGILSVAASAGDVDSVLQTLGLPEGEARFYAQEVHAGRTLVVVDANTQYPAARETLLRHGGYDVQSRGGELARPSGAGVPGGTGPRPIDVTGNWDDVSSRYEMLWQQHYGTSDATWEQMAPVYRYAWQVANDPRYRGRPWAEAESAVQRDWQAAGRAPAWSEVAGPIRDVWEDVAEEAAQGAEGGQDRRTARPDAAVS
jgi:hypothetical protein